jgi:hypothetical protein
LGHLAKIGPPACLACISVNFVCDCTRYVEQTWLIRNTKSEAPKVLRKRWTARSKWYLSEEPESMKERWVIGGTFEARLSGVRRRRGYNLGAGTKTQMLDYLPPLSRSRQDAQTDVTHIALPQ